MQTQPSPIDFPLPEDVFACLEALQQATFGVFLKLDDPREQTSSDPFERVYHQALSVDTLLNRRMSATINKLCSAGQRSTGHAYSVALVLKKMGFERASYSRVPGSSAAKPIPQYYLAFWGPQIVALKPHQRPTVTAQWLIAKNLWDQANHEQKQDLLSSPTLFLKSLCHALTMALIAARPSTRHGPCSTLLVAMGLADLTPRPPSASPVPLAYHPLDAFFAPPLPHVDDAKLSVFRSCRPVRQRAREGCRALAFAILADQGRSRRGREYVSHADTDVSFFAEEVAQTKQEKQAGEGRPMSFEEYDEAWYGEEEEAAYVFVTVSMIQCDKCLEWADLHGMSEEDANKLQHYYCQACRFTKTE